MGCRLAAHHCRRHAASTGESGGCVGCTFTRPVLAGLAEHTAQHSARVTAANPVHSPSFSQRTECTPPLFPCHQFGVFLPEVELFDAELFGLMRSEALTTDPQQRLLLHASHEALSSSGAGPAGAFGRAMGAFVGIAGEPLGMGVGYSGRIIASSFLGNIWWRWPHQDEPPLDTNLFHSRRENIPAAHKSCLQPPTTRPWCTSTAGPSLASASRLPPPASHLGASPTCLACVALLPAWTQRARRRWWPPTSPAWPSGGPSPCAPRACQERCHGGGPLLMHSLLAHGISVQP